MQLELENNAKENPSIENHTGKFFIKGIDFIQYNNFEIAQI